MIKIAFLGESVASGFLISPFFTPAGCLQDMFDSCCGETVKIIDKSKVSIRIDELTAMLKEEEVLQSDFVVIFAGNNWRKDLWEQDSDAWTEMIALMREGKNWEDEFKEMFRVWMDKKSEFFYSVIRQQFVARSIPVLFVIPEFNLRDWSYGLYEEVINCPGVESEKEREALRRLKQYPFDSKRGKKLAEDMLAVMPSNPAVPYWLARHYDLRKKYKRAFQYYCRALDTNIFRLGPPPGINSYIRENIIFHSEHVGFHVIDLRQSFHDIENGDIAGKNLFFDYCHLNVEGIKKASSLIFDRTMEILQLEKLHGECNVSVSREAESNGYFFAAIHTFHVGNNDCSLIKFLLKMAIKKDKKIIDKMYNYCIMASQKMPWYLNHCFLENNSDQYTLVRQHKDCLVMDIELVDCITEVLEDAGVSIRDEIKKEREREHAVSAGRKINLLETYYMESSYFNIFWGSRSRSFDSTPLAYKRFREKSSCFHFISRCSEVACTVTLRVPEDHGHDICFLCNGKKVGDFHLCDDNWATFSFEISELNTDGDINKLEIIWDERNALSDISSDNVFDYLRPVFGEIFSLRLGKG